MIFKEEMEEMVRVMVIGISLWLIGIHSIVVPYLLNV